MDIFKGTFEIFESDEKGNIIRKLGENTNRMVYAGREAWLDFMFGVENWFSGAAGYDADVAGSTHWHPNRMIAVGTVADDNDGYFEGNGWLLAGSGLTGTTITTGTNFAYLPNLNDNYMSSAMSGNGATDEYNTGVALFYKQADRVVRTARSVQIEATFNYCNDPANANTETIPTGTQIREMGIFLGGTPTGVISPSTDRTQRPRTMMNRSVRYTVTGGYIEDNPITVGSNKITIRYTFSDQ